MKATPHQIYRESELLKTSLLGDSLSSKEAWQKRNELSHLLELLLLTDLDYALDKKVEKDLWNIVFRNPITALQNKVREQKNVSHSQNQSQLAVMLESASGFYLQLLQKLACANDVDLLCHPRDSNFGLTSAWPLPVSVNKSSVLYICQHCLVHLGDIARYRGQSLQAETFYRHAVELIPSNGQPYNQLALLEAASGEKLSTVFFYIRSLAVQHPFPLAATNLQKLYTKMITDSNPEIKSRMSAYEYISAFLQFQALVHLGTDFARADRLMCQLTTSLPALIIAEKLETWQLIQMAAVAIFAVGHTTTNQINFETKGDLSADEQKSLALILEMITNMLNAFLLPIHAVLDPQESRDYYSVPAVKVLLDWLLLNHKLLEEDTFVKRPQIWHGLCKLLNDIDAKLPDVGKYDDVPLPEDWDLLCFLPLQKWHKGLKFQTQNSQLLDDDEVGSLRAYRLSKVGQSLSQMEIGGKFLILLSVLDDGKSRFSPAQPGILTEQVLQQIQELTVVHETSPVNGIEKVSPAIVKQASTELSGPRANKLLAPDAPAQEVRFKLDDDHQRREVAKEMEQLHRTETEISQEPKVPKDGPGKQQRERRVVRQNVAMQAILQQRAAQNVNFVPPKDAAASMVLGLEQSNMRHVMPSLQQQQQSMLIPDAPKPQDMQRDSYQQAHPLMHTQMASPLSITEQDDKSNVWMQSYNMMQPSLPGNQMPVQRAAPSYMPPSHQFPAASIDMNFHGPQFGQRPIPPQPPQPHPANTPIGKPFMSNPGMMWNYMSYMPAGNQQPNGPLIMAGQQQQQQQQQQNQQAFMMMPPQPNIEPVIAQNDRHLDYSKLISRNWQRENTGVDRGQVPYHYNFLPHGQLAANQINIQQPLEGSLPLMNQKAQTNENNLSSDIGANTYSLFSSPWSSGLTVPHNIKEGSRMGGSTTGVMDPLMMQPRIQSLWSGPGPSPLERLLEQQKQRRDAANQ